MIGSLRGRLLRKEAHRVLLDVGGVGYAVLVPFSTLFALGEPGSEASLLIHTHVREDAIQLFGFARELELQIFEKLITVSGVGPRLAVAILSGIQSPELVTALRQGDVRRLLRVPGLGKKLSERLVLELRDKVAELATDSGARDTAAGTETPSDLRADAVSALTNLGYRARDAEAAVERASDAGASDLESLLKKALALLARS